MLFIVMIVLKYTERAKCRGLGMLKHVVYIIIIIVLLRMIPRKCIVQSVDP